MLILRLCCRFSVTADVRKTVTGLKLKELVVNAVWQNVIT